MAKPWRFTAKVAADPTCWVVGVEKRAITQDGRVFVRTMFRGSVLNVGDWIITGKDGIRKVVPAAVMEKELEEAKAANQKPKGADAS